MRKITELDNLYRQDAMWVIGRGPSLAYLQPEHIGDGPVVAINQAVERVETLHLPNPLFSMQKDHYLVNVKSAQVLVHSRESLKECPADLDAFVFDCEEDFHFPWSVPSVVACAGLAYRMGCERVFYLCCDAATDGITEAYGQPATEPSAYLLHSLLVKRYARLPVSWVRVKEIVHGF